MGLYEREIKELRTKCKEVEGWDHLPKEERLKLQLQIYAHTTKKGNLILSALAIAAKQGKKARQDLMRTGLIGDTMIVDIDPEAAAKEEVYCMALNTNICREKCKERSSHADTFEFCQGCETNKTTRQLLVSKLEGRTFS